MSVHACVCVCMRACACVSLKVRLVRLFEQLVEIISAVIYLRVM